MLLPTPVLVRRARQRNEETPSSNAEPPGCARAFWILTGLFIVGLLALLTLG